MKKNKKGFIYIHVHQQMALLIERPVGDLRHVYDWLNNYQWHARLKRQTADNSAALSGDFYFIWPKPPLDIKDGSK